MRCGYYSYFRGPHFFSLDALLDLLTPIPKRDSAHGKGPTAIPAMQSVPLFVVPGNAEFLFGLAIPRLQLVVIDRPIAATPEIALQLEVTWDEPRGIPSPGPGASANHPVVPGLERIFSFVRIVIIVLRVILLVGELPLRLFCDRREDS